MRARRVRLYDSKVEIDLDRLVGYVEGVGGLIVYTHVFTIR